MSRRSWRDRRFDAPSWFERLAVPFVGAALGAVVGLLLQPAVLLALGASGGVGYLPLLDQPVLVLLLCHRGGGALLGAAIGGGVMAWIAEEER